MRHLILSLSMLGSLMAVEGHDYNMDLDVLAFGISHHFQNTDNYKFKEFNPGLGLALWGNFNDRDDTVINSIGVVLAEYNNSYNTRSVIKAMCGKLQIGKTENFHGGIIYGLGNVSGYDGTSEGDLAPIGAISVGYRWINLDMTYIPRFPSESQVTSAAIAVWLRFNVYKF